MKKQKFRVIITESQNYEIFVEAEDEDSAKEIAEENYGCDGTVTSTFVEVACINKLE